MIRRHKIFKRSGLVGIAFVLLFTVILPLIPVKTAEAAPADPEVPTFIDKVSIRYKDKTWTDYNPYDGTHNYTAGLRSCRYALTVTDWDSGAKATGVIRGDPDNDGHCDILPEDAGGTFENLAMAGTERRNWTAYRLSQEEIYLPIGTERYVGACTNGPGAVYQQSRTFIEAELAELSFLANNNLGPVPAILRQGFSDWFSSLTDLTTQGVLVDHGEFYHRTADGSGPDNDYRQVQDDGDYEADNKVKINNNPRGEFYITPRCEGTVVDPVVPWAPGTDPNPDVMLAFDGRAVDSATEACVPSVYEDEVTEGVCSPENDPSAGGSSQDDEDGEVADPCTDKLSQEGGFGWVICPILEMIDKASLEMHDQISNMLEVSPSVYSSDQGLRTAWSYFRNIASFLLIIIGLVMVIGQATNKE
jgi:hypothetical protein